MKYLSFISNNGKCWKISVTDNGDLILSLMTDEEIILELEGE